MSVFEAVADLELAIDGYRLERREEEVSSEFRRVTTTVVVTGKGLDGRGEDVTYDPEDHDHYPHLDLVGRRTLAELSASLEGVDLFPSGEPGFAASREYRRWAVESAVFDLALRQARTSLGEAIGREYRPVRFVMSTRQDPFAWLAIDETLEFKLDPTGDWTREFMEALAGADCVRVLDLKAYYPSSAVEHTEDVALYEAVRDLFPTAIIEDASLAPEMRAVLESAGDRLSFDAPIHSIADIESLDIEPRCLNIKPSRFGTIERLLDTLDWCEERGLMLYGGGQFELGVGRDQLHTVASLFYPDGPNDVAPREYNGPYVQAGLPRSPLEPSPTPVGLTFGSA